jgi:hypothetical protein
MQKPWQQIPSVLGVIVLAAAAWSCGPSFVEQVVDSSPPTDPWMKAVGDLNGDGKPDLVLCGRAGPLVWYENPSWARHTISSATGPDESSTGIAIADVDGNGSPDVVLANGVWFANPRPSGDPVRDTWVRHQIDQAWGHDVFAIDLDRDGRVDVVKRHQGTAGDVIRVFRQGPGDTWTERDIPAPSGEGLAVGDVDGDGDPDIVIGGTWYQNDGDIVSGAWTPHVYTRSYDYPNVVVRIADIGGSSRPDIVLSPSEPAGGSYRISWFEAPSDPKGLWAEHILVDPVETVVHGLAVADFNLDGEPDVAYAQMNQGADPDLVEVLLRRGSGYAGVTLSQQGSHDIVAADLDGDGRPDLFGANWSTAQAPDHAVPKIWLDRITAASQ